MTIKTLVVDDSRTMRALISSQLSAEHDIEVIGAASNAAEARVMIRELDPDVITLDIEMPGMNGLDFLEKIMTLRPKPVIVVSSLAAKGTDATIHALELGAFECYSKPKFGAGDGQLADLVRLAARHGVRSFGYKQLAGSKIFTNSRPATRLIAIGASTGGVEALSRVLAFWPRDCPPTMIVQHISGFFSEALVRNLNSLCPATVISAESDTYLQSGHVYVAPGSGRHLVVRGGERLKARLVNVPPQTGHRPSVDMLFGSVAETVSGAAVGVLLTGMGEDGAKGLLAMRQSGCVTIAQDRETSTVYGMPRVAAEIGAADHILAIDNIAEKIFY
ncbi:MAG: chemotaxis response regulator protein-glutamate methylesterase [Pseudomonadota bacterium]